MSNSDVDLENLDTLPPETALTLRGPHLLFALAAVYGAIALVLWVVAFRMEWADRVPATMWHAHEMLYGFAAAGLAGVLAAAVPRWSHAAPIADARLTLLAGVWIAGRIAMVAAQALPAWLVVAIDLSFVPLLAVVVVLPHVAARPAWNIGLLLVLAALLLGQVLMDAEALGQTYALAERGSRIGTDAFLLLLAAIGGYAIPDMTNRAFAAYGQPTAARSLFLVDVIAVGLLVAYLVAEALGISAATSGAIALAAAIANGVRLWLWRGYRLRSASASMLHLAYVWLIVGLLLDAAVPIAGARVEMAAIHVLTAGAIGTALLAVIARESVLHETHRLEATPASLAAYWIVSIAIVLRVAALFVPGAFVGLVIGSGIVWAGGFLVLLGTYLSQPPAPSR